MTTNEAAKRLTPCGECGMRVAPQEYHPFTYCVLYKAGQNPREAFAAERRATVERIDWQAVRSAISNAYYETREAGGTMEAAADSAVAHVRAILDEEAAR